MVPERNEAPNVMPPPLLSNVLLDEAKSGDTDRRAGRPATPEREVKKEIIGEVGNDEQNWP